MAVVTACARNAQSTDTARKEDLSHGAEAGLKNITAEVTFLVIDLRQEENCRKLMEAAIKQYGRIDVLVNNAGITGTPAPVHQMSSAMFTEVMECNVYSAFYCSHYALAQMVGQGGSSSVIHVSSVAGLTGFPGHSAYVTSKHALCGLTKNMAMDYAKYNIRVNAVNPGTTDTPMYHEALAYLQYDRCNGSCGWRICLLLKSGVQNGVGLNPPIKTEWVSFYQHFT